MMRVCSRSEAIYRSANTARHYLCNVSCEELERGLTSALRLKGPARFSREGVPVVVSPGWFVAGTCSLGAG